MSSDWVTGAFTLAGSVAGAGLTGTLTLATTRAQRWQTKVQLDSADAQRAQDVRRDGYTRLITAASALSSGWQRVLDQQKAEGVDPNDLRRGDPSLETAHDLHGQVHGLRVELDQAVATVQLLGPSEVGRAAEAVRDHFQHLDHISEDWYRFRNAGAAELEMQHYQLHYDQSGICGDILDKFAREGRAALGLH